MILPTIAHAITPLQLSGAISGIVAGTSGAPQIGATVLLLNRQERVFRKVVTDDKGEFRFPGLLPDLYSIRVTLAAFVPAIKRDISVRAGSRSFLNVNLNSFFSTIQLSYPPTDSGAAMSDDWKWMLRGAAATRPILRFAETESTLATVEHSERPAVFSDTRALVKVSAGDGALVSAIGTQADLGTAFALATSFYGNNNLQVSGNVGYGSQTGVPSASFRTSYSRDFAGGSPEVSVTMRQLFLPSGRLAAALTGNDTALPMLRTMSASLEDRTDLTDQLSLRYGMTIDAVTFLDRLSYFSPFARLTYSLGDAGTVELTYTSGNARPELGVPQDRELQRDLNTLSLFPRMSMHHGRVKVQRGQEFEIAYSRKVGSRTYSLSAYRELLANAALSLVGPEGLYGEGEVLPDLFSGSQIFNAGDHQSTGLTASVTQTFGDHLSATLFYGSMGALTAEDRQLVTNDPDELRSLIHSRRKQAAAARVVATAPVTGTHMIASYQWSDDHRSAMPGNAYSTQSGRPLPGLNVYIRQPLPRIGAFPRMEATADLRNMLAQGYLPLNVAGGQQMLLVETPRSVRGGLSFIF
jgi:hypothetical protein